MKVLFAVSSEKVSEQIIERYRKEYKEILRCKNVYYFDAIINEIQKDKTYDRIVISEDLETFPTNNPSVMDANLFKKLDSISDEAQDTEGNETNIILICSDRRTKNSSLLVKLFSIGIYNALIENDRNIEKVCSLIKKPRSKKEAKIYYKIDSDNATYKSERENEVNEVEIQNILTYFKKISRNPEKFTEGFNNIALQYNDAQLKIIINCLPPKVRAVLEKESVKYREIVKNRVEYNNVEIEQIYNKNKTGGIKVNSIGDNDRPKISKPIVIPSAIKKTEKRKVVVTPNKNREKQYPKIEKQPENINKNTKVLDRKLQNNKIKQNTIEKNNSPRTNIIENNIEIEKNKKIEIENLVKMENFENLQSNEELNKENVKKGRGRPRKYPIPTEVKPKGKRGRPRKIQTEEEKNEEDIFEELNQQQELFNANVKENLNNEKTVKVEEEFEVPTFNDEDEEEFDIPTIDDEDEEEFDIPTIDDEDEEEFEIPTIDDEDEEEFNISTIDDEDEEEFDIPTIDDEDEEEFNISTIDDEDEEEFNISTIDDEDEEEFEIPTIDDEDEEEFDIPTFDDEDEEEFDIPTFDDEDEEEFNISKIEEDDAAEMPMFDEEDDSLELPAFEDDDDDMILPTFEEELPKSKNENSIQAPTIKSNIDYSMSTLNSVMTKDKKIVTFLGTSKNGTSFLVNNLAAIFDSMGINTAILDMTKNKNSYYIYTNNEEKLRKIAYKSIINLKNGYSEGIKVGKNLTVYTTLPNDGNDYSDAESILSTLVQNHSLILIDCDFTTDPSYFANCQEIYLVQSMDILTIQPLTMFLRELKTKNVLDSEKVRVVVNKELKMRALTSKMVIAGMSFYNDPAMAFMTDLFNKDLVKACTIPFDENAYSKYLDGMVNCKVSISGYSKNFIAKLKVLAEMVYPRISQTSYQPTMRNTNFGNNNFSDNMNSTLEQMRKKY